jgi:hypothetical protein
MMHRVRSAGSVGRGAFSLGVGRSSIRHLVYKEGIGRPVKWNRTFQGFIANDWQYLFCQGSRSQDNMGHNAGEPKQLDKHDLLSNFFLLLARLMERRRNGALRT